MVKLSATFGDFLVFRSDYEAKSTRLFQKVTLHWALIEKWSQYSCSWSIPYVSLNDCCTIFFSIVPTGIQFVYPTSYKATAERRYNSCCIATWFLSCKLFIIHPPAVQNLCLFVCDSFLIKTVNFCSDI